MNIIKMAILPKVLSTLIIISIKILKALFSEVKKADPKLHMKLQGAPE